MCGGNRPYVSQERCVSTSTFNLAASEQNTAHVGPAEYSSMKRGSRPKEIPVNRPDITRARLYPAFAEGVKGPPRPHEGARVSRLFYKRSTVSRRRQSPETPRAKSQDPLHHERHGRR